MYWGDDRGQSIQIGAVLLFGALIVALAGYQAFVVPQQNEQVEFSHSQTVQNDLQDLRNALASMTGEASARSVSVQLGTRYPARVIAVNPGPPSGSLRTEGTRDPAVAFEVVNANATGETGDFWTGTDVRNYSTGALVYQPNYNLYGGAPTTYVDNTVVANRFPSGTVTLTGQTFVDGNRVSLVALNGSLGRTRAGTTSVDVRPVSVATTTVSVTSPDPSSPVTLRLPTKLDRETWLDLLDDQLDGPNGHVSSVDVVNASSGPTFDTLVVTLEAGENYTLELAKVGVGTRVTGTNQTYVTDVSGNGTTVPTDGRTSLTVAVRDSYDNPVSGVPVRASPSNGSLTATERVTDGDGQATFTLKAPSTDGPVDVNFSFEHDPVSAGVKFDSGTPENATMTVVVQEGGSGGDPSTPDYIVDWRDAGDVAGAATNPAESCVEIPCREPLSLGTIANPADPGKVVTYYVNDSSTATLSPTVGATNGTGEHDTTLELVRAGDVLLSASNTTGASDLLVDTLVASTFDQNADNWTTFGSFEQDGTTGRTDTGQSNRGNWAYRIDGGSPGGIETAEDFDTSDAQLLTLEYWAEEDGPEGDEGPGEGGEDLVVEYLRQNGDPDTDADWIEIDRLPAEQDGVDEYRRRARLTASDAFHRNFRVRFRQVGADAGSDEWYVDDVVLRSYSQSGASSGGGDDGGDDGSDTTAPAISAVSLSDDGSGNLALTFDSDEQLDTLSVSVDGPATTNVYTFDESDFSESSTGGSYTYTLTTTQAYDDGGGTYTATVDDALDAAGNNGGVDGEGSGLSDTYDYSSGPPATQNGLRYEGGLTSTDTGSAIQFDVSNVDSSFARIEGIRVSVQNGVDDRIYNGDPREFEITGGDSDGYRDDSGEGNPTSRSFAADGTSIDLTQNGVLSTSGGGSSATVFVGQFGTASGNSFIEYDFGSLTRVSSSDDWDVKVVLELQNRGDVTFYFDES